MRVGAATVGSSLIAVERQVVPSSGLRGLIARHPIASFLVICYSITVVTATSSALTRRDLLPFDQAPYDLIAHLVGSALAAFVVAGAVGGSSAVRELASRVFRFRAPIRWYAIALFGVPVLTLLGSVAFDGSVPLRRIAADWPVLFTDSLPHLAFVLIFSNFAEEVGWTGFVYDRLQGRFSPMKASLLVAIPFALFHVPGYIVEEGLAAAPILLLVLFVPQYASRIIAAWLYNGTGRSVFFVGLFHCSFNVTGAGFADTFLPGTSEELFVLTSGVVMLAAIGIAIATRGRLSYQSEVDARVGAGAG
jgi:uncharacterized protein